MSTLGDLLDRDLVATLAGTAFFERGQRYAADGRVRALNEDDTAIAGIVSGTHDYQVRIWVEDDAPAYACDCPAGLDGLFCKHLAALALEWLNSPARHPATDASARRAARHRPRPITMGDVREYLDGQDRATLVDMILAEAERDDRLRERLTVRTAMSAAAGAGAGEVRRAIDRAVRMTDFVDYAGAYDYARGVHDAIDLVEDLLRAGQPAAVIDLAEHALRRVERAIESVDDSDGEMGGLLERLQELHLAACLAARPDPEALAARLFAWELADTWDVFHDAPETYADVLGATGLAAYRRLAEVEWAKVPTLGPETEERRTYETRRYRVTSIMESLARAADDLDELITIKSRDLSVAYRFLQIAKLCSEAGRDDEALEWAERGLHEFPKATDSRLREFLAELYHRRSRHAEAMDLIWAEFTEQASLEHYQLLKAHADRIDAWPEWRTRALDACRGSIVERRAIVRPARFRWETAADGSPLVRIYLWEGEYETAWQEAQALGCSDRLWSELAGQREADHPADAVPIYQREVAALLDAKRNDAYQAAVKLLVRIGRLMARIGGDPEFGRYLASVRAAHGRKRNFIKLLDAARW